jgi:hypothetical protein
MKTSWITTTLWVVLTGLFGIASAEAATTNVCGTVTALGAATSHEFVTTLGTNCTFSIAQPAVTDLANVAGGTVLANNGGTSAAPAATAAPVLGIASSQTGSLGLANSNTANAITIYAGSTTTGPTAAYNLNLPVSAGSAGQALVSEGGGSTPMQWATIVAAARTVSSQTGTTLALASAGDATMYDNLGNSGTLTATMTQTAGDNWCFTVVAAHPIIITAGAASTINYGGTISATAGNMTSSTVGAVACVYVESGTADFVYSATGPWAVT